MQKSLMFSIKQFFPGAAQWSANFPQRFPNTNARLREIARRGYEDADTTAEAPSRSREPLPFSFAHNGNRSCAPTSGCSASSTGRLN
jgi:hypothetical protein